jgi:hypothetical protein
MPVIRSRVAQTAAIELDRLILEPRLAYPIDPGAAERGGGLVVNALLGKPRQGSEFGHRSEAQHKARCADPQVCQRVVRR